jgi:hypothetical protein
MASTPGRNMTEKGVSRSRGRAGYFGQSPPRAWEAFRLLISDGGRHFLARRTPAYSRPRREIRIFLYTLGTFAGEWGH